jgi:iron complex outermembrane receptor protein
MEDDTKKYRFSSSKWLDNDFLRDTFSAITKNVDVIIGGGYNKYEGFIWKVIWSRYASPSELGDRYYEITRQNRWKYFKANYQITDT